MRACRFSSVRSLSRPAKCSAQRAGVGVDHRLDRDLAEVDPERLGEPLCVAARRVRRVARRHRHAVHPLGAERLDAQRRRQRRVDAARQADHDVAEAVLGHVVVQAELEREPHLLELVELGHARGATRAPAAAGRLDRSSAAPGAPPSRNRARLRAGSRSKTSNSSSKPARASTSPSASTTTNGRRRRARPAPPTALQSATETPLSRARGAQHVLALAVLADVERRRRDVRDELRAGGAELRRGRPGDARCPRRSVSADARAGEVDQHLVVRRLEVPVLVEHAVVRQVVLAIDGLHRRRPRARSTRCRACRPRGSGAPTSAVIPCAVAATLSTAARAARRKPGRSSRSSAG